VETDEGFSKADKSVAIESAEDLTADVMGDDEGDVRFGVEFTVDPDFTGDLDAALEFVESVERAYRDVRSHGKVFSYEFSVLTSEKGSKRPGNCS